MIKRATTKKGKTVREAAAKEAAAKEAAAKKLIKGFERKYGYLLEFDAVRCRSRRLSDYIDSKSPESEERSETWKSAIKELGIFPQDNLERDLQSIPKSLAREIAVISVLAKKYFASMLVANFHATRAAALQTEIRNTLLEGNLEGISKMDVREELKKFDNR